MAVQYHVAFSSEVSGSAIFAGGPYYCAQGQITNALTTCTTFPEVLDVSALESAAQGFASNGQIDNLSGLSGDKVFLYSGTADTVVKTEVVQAAGSFFQNFGANVTTMFSTPSEHCQPTLNFGNDCSELASPYISRCGYDGVGGAFGTLFPTGLRPRGKGVTSNVIKVQQSKYFPSGDVPGLDDTAYLYVPTACQQGTKCSVHIAFHGCSQDLASIGMVFVQNAGYLQWAETNNIIVLFPQAAPALFHENPEACFDWWGYVDSNYAFKTSQQMTTFRNMVKAIGTVSGPILAK